MLLKINKYNSQNLTGEVKAKNLTINLYLSIFYDSGILILERVTIDAWPKCLNE